MLSQYSLGIFQHWWISGENSWDRRHCLYRWIWKRGLIDCMPPFSELTIVTFFRRYSHFDCKIMFRSLNDIYTVAPWCKQKIMTGQSRTWVELKILYITIGRIHKDSLSPTSWTSWETSKLFLAKERSGLAMHKKRNGTHQSPLIKLCLQKASFGKRHRRLNLYSCAV